MIQDIFQFLSDESLSNGAKLALTLLALVRYFYRRKQNEEDMEVGESNEPALTDKSFNPEVVNDLLSGDIGEMVKREINERFEKQNEVLIQKFDRALQ